MKGDFSKWGLNPTDNDSGVLHQQGRVLLDQDWNAAEHIGRLWRETAAADVIGSGIAAVPATSADSLKVTQADASATGIDISLNAGRLWVDGVHLYYTGTTPLSAEYFAPPLQSPQAAAADIADGVRDAVILEVWDESFSAFQDPLQLLEPALGGPDTTQRVRTAMALKLLRLDAEDDCGNLDLADDFSAKGHLTVTPSPTTIVAGPCPVPEAGGYSGFEHALYRIEIATPAGGEARFKWSQFNGGLVGRGAFTSTGASTGDVAVTANNQMINQCGLDTFYLEALDFDPAAGHWRVVLSADATLPSDDNLSLTSITGTWPAGPSGFFRLWNGIELISAYPTGLVLANELPNQVGIRLAFDAPLAALGNYSPGDFWTFPARAAGVDFDPSVWPTDAEPQGVHHHRAPLAIITWSGGVPVTTSTDDIHDCRHVFQPLAKLQSCCTVKVGDGLTSFGDFDRIQDAINALPTSGPKVGGEVCILPGRYTEDIHIDNLRNITLRGCGTRTRIRSAAALDATDPDPVIRITGSTNIRIESLALGAHPNGIGIHVEADPQSGNLVFDALYIEAAGRSALQIDAGRFITLSDSTALMDNVPSAWPAVYVQAEDVLIEDNVLRVQGHLDNNPNHAEVTPSSAVPHTASAGRGGLQIGGTSERVRVIDNLIDGGIGNGITLGSVEEVDAGGNLQGIIGWVTNALDPCDPCAPGDGYIPPHQGGDDTPEYQSAGPLYDILIEHNRIHNMGLNGIGAVAFFSLDEADDFISVENLTIERNEIHYCLWRPLAVIPTEMLNAMGYGAIALADVANLVIRANALIDNGPSHIEPVCGIYVLHGEGVDISDNRILNNGAKDAQPMHSGKDGARGGIHIVLAVPPTVPTTILRLSYPVQNGVPALKVHDNIVSQPLGQALILRALGPVSVVNNQFTSRGMIIRMNPLSSSFIAATVAIHNLGLSNELYGQLTTFAGLETVSLAKGATMTDNELVLPGLDDAKAGRYLANGNVLFSDNQVTLDLMETGIGFALSSIMIISLDDIGFHANQCECNLVDDFVVSHAALLGVALRASDNRFKEGLANALFSALTAGFFNATTNNQSTHCLLVIGLLPSLKNDRGNCMAVSIFGENYCENLMEGLFAAGFNRGKKQ